MTPTNSSEQYAVQMTVTDVYPYADYNSAWSGEKMYYERPEVILKCDSSFGEQYLQIPLQNITSGNFNKVIEQHSLYNSKTGIDLHELIGETVFVAMNDTYQFGTFSKDKYGVYEKGNAICVSDNDFFLSYDTEKQITLGYETKTTEYINRVLTTDWEREHFGTNGWIETALSGEHIDTGFRVSATIGIACTHTITWTFTSNLDGMKNAKKFMNTLGLPDTPLTEFEGYPVYLKPVRDIHYTNRDAIDTELFDDLERWAVSTSALAPDTQKPPLHKRIKSFFKKFATEASITVEIESEDTRRAKSSVRSNKPKSVSQSKQ